MRPHQRESAVLAGSSTHFNGPSIPARASVTHHRAQDSREGTGLASVRPAPKFAFEYADGFGFARFGASSRDTQIEQDLPRVIL